MLKFEEVNYDYFGKCLKICDGRTEMLVTIDVGPRIISYRLNGKENIMCEDKKENSTMEGGVFSEVFGERKWYIYGGHRLWFSPEHNPKSYFPDNDKVRYEILDNKVILTPPPQLETGMQFVLEIEFSENKAKINHIIQNIGEDDIKISPWAMTVVDENSLAILPQSSKDTGLLSNRNLSLWAYTDIYDDRLFIGNKYITIKQDSDCKNNLKVGFNNEDGWLAMVNKSQLFVKKFDYIENAEYPDNHCNCECFTNFFMMEIESLGELKYLSKGEKTSHAEVWELYDCDKSFDPKNENEISKFVKDNIPL
ncbi:MAG: hypothetical protein GX896_07660 [Clostridiales bacterium]|nr:hypothetical protein [Clostridiales bacterium]